jgi:UDP-glucose 4-epimerase
MDSRRILITGLSSQVGGRLAQVLEREPEVEAIIGVDTRDPRHELERTEFVRVDTDHGLLRRILKAATIDTVVDTRLIADPLRAPLRSAHEVNVVGTANILAASSEPGTPVRKLVFKSSAHYYGCEQGDPAFFSEDMSRSQRPRTELERDVVEAESAVAEFAARNPQTFITIVRLADEIGAGDEPASHLALLSLPVVPAFLGFDPRLQFIHEDDVVGVLSHVVRRQVPGVYNAAGDGVLALSEVVSLLGKPLLPILPPWGPGFAARQLRRLGLRIPVEMLRQLRFGRGLDNRRLKATGYAYRYTTREAVLKLRAQQRLRPLLGSGGESYRYEREVEEFLHRSPSVRTPLRVVPDEAVADGAPMPSYDDLSSDEVIEIAESLEPSALSELRRYEAATRAREQVLTALDRMLARRAR